MVFPNSNLIPTLSAGPDPVTIVNSSTSSTGVPTQYKVYIACSPTHNIGTMRAATIAGATGYNYLASSKYYPGGLCCTRNLDGALGDGGASPQSPSTPSTVRVMVLT